MGRQLLSGGCSEREPLAVGDRAGTEFHRAVEVETTPNSGEELNVRNCGPWSLEDSRRLLRISASLALSSVTLPTDDNGRV